MTGRLNQSLRRNEPTRERDSEIKLERIQRRKLVTQFLELSRRFLLQSAFNLRVEVSERGCRVRVKDGRVDVGVVVVHEASLGRLVDQTVLQHVLASQKDWQPLIVADVLVLSDVDAAGFLENGFVVPLRVDALERVGESVVLTQKNDLQDC